MQIGPYTLKNRLILSPMAGITDQPFRRVCLNLGAAMTVAEMTSANPHLRNSKTSLQRSELSCDPEPRVAQIAGTDPDQLADFARHTVARGAQIIDINMGCPAKNVCGVMAGSALLRDEPRVAHILDAVVSAVEVPITLKIRTGWDRAHRNAVRIAQIAERAGIQSLAVHGRTRADHYQGDVDYDTIAAVKAAVHIPVVANGDITSPDKAQQVLARTGADALMIGRGAQGRPWLFREIAHTLETGKPLAPPGRQELRTIILSHIRATHNFYGPVTGVRMARKHIQWYVRALPGGATLWRQINRVCDANEQLNLLEGYLTQLNSITKIAA